MSVERMRKNKRRICFVMMVVFALLLSCAGRGPEGAAERFADLGTHRLRAIVAGEGTPAVVIEAGVGAGAGEYAALQEGLAVRTMVIAYDRAGYGGSGEGPLPRGAEREAEELKRMLEALGIPGPYLLVGHSLGGLNAQVFADL